LILCEHANDTPNAFEELAVFVGQMNAAGQKAKINVDRVPQPLHRNMQYEVEPFLCEVSPAEVSKVILLGADTIGNAKLAYLRTLNLHPETGIYAIGSFAEPQTKISVLSKLSYVLGKDPVLIDSADFRNCPDDPLFAIGVPAPKKAPNTPRVLLLAPNLEDQRTLEDVYSVSLSKKYETTIITNGKSKDIWQKTFGFGTRIFQFSELPPVDLSVNTDICVLMQNVTRNLRAKTILWNVITSGAAIIDCSQSDFGRSLDGFAVQGPINIASLSAYITQEILPNAADLGESTRLSRLASKVNVSKLLGAIDTDEPSQSVESANPPSILFVPTNGVGLGHAQRCSLVASELTVANKAKFAAFPSCLPMLNRYGFDGLALVSRSDLHAEPHSNDLLNYMRLSSSTDAGDIMVFDGGYVFDSIFRTIANQKLRSVWIRRGLWQAQQNNSVALDREKIFDRVIVPMEAFEELNHQYSDGPRLKTVGPIVQQPDPAVFDRERLRDSLKKRFGFDFSKLTVTMLGGGVAADRTAQVQAICAGMEKRKDTLNLVVTWPTARIDPGWFSWKNSRIVRTHHANPLVSACDLFISAVGYNSFHEAMYNAVPTIFIPQMSSFMDDQRARAEAASSRGAAILIEPTQMSTLDREIDNCLEGSKAGDIKSVLAELELRLPGNAAAARYIEELAYEYG